MSRTKSSIKNFIYALIGQCLGIAISFISRIFFVRILGNEFLGINGLFTNILTVLSLAELGVGTAITYSLYKPLAESDTQKCKMLMQLYKKIYIVIGIVILILGVAITPLLQYLIKDMPDITNLNLIYILFVFNTSVSYFFSYKRNLIIADQNRYIATIYRYGFYFILNVFQIIYLIIEKNYIGFLILQIIATLLENIFVSLKADKMYPYLKDKDKVPLDSQTKMDIIKNTKAMMMHKVGSVVVTSTDNIILSSFVNVVAVGIYSNYQMISKALSTVTSQIFNSITASVGNLCASSDVEKQYNIFMKINFLSFWIFCFISSCLVSLYNPFIEIWLGKDYLFDISIVILLVINFYITGMRRPPMVFREATGLFYKDRWKAIIEAVLNLILSIFLAIKFGISGVFVGTVISSLLTSVWVEPYVLYRYGFNINFIKYIVDYIKKLVITVAISAFVYLCCSYISGNLLISFMVKTLVCLIVPNFVLFLLFKNTDEYKYFYNKLILKILKKLKLIK